MARILSMVLAGGEGTRLYPLTQSRSKPSVPFGGSYRLIDFALNNFVNSDFLRIYVLTQFKSQSLNVHLRKAWHLTGITDRFIDAIPAQMRMGKRWYDGTADAIYQNSRFIEIDEPDHVCIFGSDHIYKMDIRQMVDFHQHNEAELTVAAIQVPVSEANQFGIIEVDEEGRMIGFEEKPTSNPKTIPGDPDHVLASMGNYVFEAKCLMRELKSDAEDESSSHDFGKDIIPKLYPNGKVFVYNFNDNKINGEQEGSYWRDVGTISAYWQAHMDLLEDEPPFSLYNRKWPLHTYYPPLPPATFKDCESHETQVSQSLVSGGCYILGSSIDKSVLGFRCHIRAGSRISGTIMLGNTKVGENCVIRNAIIDKDVEIAPGTLIGEDLELDRRRFTVSDEGIVVIPKGSKVGF
ncbi:MULTISPECIES: glucose-1-phosphate adenylyltransferase [unclassified Motilimonas]|uniref:glucose-1-phosphate adenylyltransferase n=1 Tax=Motilimonas TaxID=1914248 RepID=UPI001E49321C|nr:MULTISPECIES: glucose-1-phosphate adenylyltransferase [unclassified Motilimonas]MCE0558206.1 glucose-1-phosphate adenylyltransferase [Motilimonas sp. E26]MDO6526386.1 glucose-1-phosphate adenylyltransferase [Motilimonas sp. 1_MG-2023]